MATIKDVAKLAGVSIGSVSHVLRNTTPVSEQLRRKVMSAINHLDYHPNLVARSLKTKETRVLAILVPDLTIPFYPQLIRGAESAALEHNYSLFAISTEESGRRQRQLLSLLRAQRVDGILIVSVASGSASVVSAQNTNGNIPVVFVDRVPANVRVDSVSVDNVAAAEMCVKHLIDVGHRRIAICVGPLTLENEQERLQGYRSALRAAGIAIDEELICESNFTAEEVAAACEEHFLSSAIRPSAIFATNGSIALGVIRALRSHRLTCPRDIAFATFDQLAVDDFFEPRITTVVQPAHDMGYHACEMLVKRIGRRTREETRQIRMTAELWVRESSSLVSAAKESRINAPLDA